jgi:hypothetical protein
VVCWVGGWVGGWVCAWVLFLSHNHALGQTPRSINTLFTTKWAVFGGGSISSDRKGYSVIHNFETTMRVCVRAVR